MKKILFILATTVFIFGCNSGDKKDDETKTDSQVGVPNVNGNIPDTTNAIRLSTDVKDTSGMNKDTVK
ncbi:MAG: hypothetical protein ABI416_05450 [Ginsengibacter sp.]